MTNLKLSDIDNFRGMIDSNAELSLDSNATEEFEDGLIKQGGKLYRKENAAHIVLDGVIYPARSARHVRWASELFSPKGLSIVFNWIK